MYWSLVAGHFPTVPMIPALGAHAYFFSLGLPLLQFFCVKWLPELLVGFISAQSLEKLLLSVGMSELGFSGA